MQRRTLKRIIFGWLSLIVIVALLGKVTIAAPTIGGITPVRGTTPIRGITPINRTVVEFPLIEVGNTADGIGSAYTTVPEGDIVAH
jgi:hypothetical protein